MYSIRACSCLLYTSGKTVPSAEEISYLVGSLAKLFPKAKITAQGVKYSFAGIRPLPYSPDHRPSTVTRRHILHNHSDDGAARMISVIGGKLTTAASLARHCARTIGLHVPEPGTVAMGPGPALDPVLDGAVLELARIGAVSQESAQGLLEWHGRRAGDIARMAPVSYTHLGVHELWQKAPRNHAPTRNSGRARQVQGSE